MKMNFNKTGMRRAVIINIVYFAMIAGIIYFLLRNFVPMFAPFLIGFVLASVLAPLIRRICAEWKVKRSLVAIACLIVCYFVIFSAISIWWIFRYGKKIKADPSKSLMLGEKTKFQFDRNELVKLKVGFREKLVLLDIVACLAIIMYGFLKSGWGTIQLTGVFLMMGIIAALIYGWSPDKIAEEFINGCADIVFGALIVGIARATLVVLQDGMVIDTIINTLANQLVGLPSAVAAQGMLLIQTMINFIIPSGSGQATTIIPIMAPLGDLIGVSREMTVLTFQMGDGLSNLLWPTANIAIGCGISGVPLSKWWKFFVPLFGILYVTQMLTVVFAQVFLGF